MIRRRVVVRGHVQGVFFRDTAQRLAARHGVAGWVRNNADGSVEAVFEGEREAVEILVRFMHEGPRGADVRSVDIQEEQAEGASGFSVD
ncbi:MAG: acylphosphatase [Actinomycetota bacterium]|nr:acylphosphatase [Actinomycetota bacterium]